MQITDLFRNEKHDGILSHWIIHLTDLLKNTGSFRYETSELWVSLFWFVHNTE